MSQTIKEPTLRELADARSPCGISAVGQRGGYAVTVTYEMQETQRLLANARGETRIFSNLNTLAGFLKRLGITTFEVDSSGYVQARVRRARPDRSVAMRRTRTRPRQVPLEFDERGP